MKLFLFAVGLGLVAAAVLEKELTPFAVDLVAVVGTKLFFKAATSENVGLADYFQFCHTQGFQTAMIESSAEQEAIHGYMIVNAVSGGFWLGGWKINHDSNWTWMAGDREMNFTNWMDGQPSGSLNHSCVWYPSATGEWRESRCTDTWIPLCQLIV